MSQKKILYLLSGLLIFINCNNFSNENQEIKNDYPIQSINIRDVNLTDNFWLPLIQKIQKKTIRYAIDKCKEEGRIDNFLIAGGKMEGKVKGFMPFDDSDVYKIIEGASYSLVSSPNPELEELIDKLIDIIRIGQEADGYLTTWRTINPAKPPAEWVIVTEGKRWEYLHMSHELYNAGHLYEAASQHYKATGKSNFLDIALLNADLMVETFGDEINQIKDVPGHQIIETGLIKLYRLTGKKDYLKLAKYFLDKRGEPRKHKLYGGPNYSQDHAPVIEQNEVVGHAVRALYMYAAMTDIAALKKDDQYLKAVNNLWDNMINKKIYITGGLGAKHKEESFGENYELPNLTAYNETCASIGSVYWNHRLFNLTKETKYFDVIERTLYNGLISGLSIDGTNFFYPNALESDGVFKFNKGSCTRKGWFDCSCCPTNLIRFLPSIPELIYSQKEDHIYANLYVSNETKFKVHDKNFKLIQNADMPWNGDVGFKFSNEDEIQFTLNLRIPYWARNEVIHGSLYSYVNKINSKIKLKINGDEITPVIDDNFIIINRIWKNNDKIEISFPMEVRTVRSNPMVKSNIGKLSLERGPIVYAFEEIDNFKKMDNLAFSAFGPFETKSEPQLLNGVNSIYVNDYKAIPYFSWSNRGVGKMKVWVDHLE